MSRISCGLILDTFELMPTKESTKETKEELQLKGRIARHIRHLRQSFMEAQTQSGNRMSQERFAELAGLPWKTINNAEESETWPSIVTLNRILQACDSNLAEFFGNLVTRSELAAIEHRSKEESEWLAQLLIGLSHPKTRRFVAEAARTVHEWLEALERE